MYRGCLCEIWRRALETNWLTAATVPSCYWWMHPKTFTCHCVPQILSTYWGTQQDISHLVCVWTFFSLHFKHLIMCQFIRYVSEFITTAWQCSSMQMQHTPHCNTGSNEYQLLLHRPAETNQTTPKCNVPGFTLSWMQKISGLSRTPGAFSRTLSWASNV